MEAALLAAVLLDALHDLVALFPEAVHLHDLLGRVLQVAVDDHAAVALRLLKPGEHGGLLAEVAAEMHADHMGVRFARFADFRPGLVPGAVVHEQQLVRDAGLVQDAGHGFGCGRDHLFFIVGGEYNRKHSLPFSLVSAGKQ